MKKVDALDITIKPSMWAYLRACIRVIEGGRPVTQINLAKELHISPQAVWKYLRRHPDVMVFVDEELRADNQRYYGLVHRRMAVAAMQGSPQHAEIFFKVEAGHYARAAADGSAPVATGGIILNMLVPCAEVPTVAMGLIPRPSAAVIPTVQAAPATPTAPTARTQAAGRDVPTVRIR